MDKNKLQQHDLYKPVFLIRLEDLDPARHHLLFECYGCGFVEDVDIPTLIEKEGSANRAIRPIAEWGGLPEMRAEAARLLCEDARWCGEENPRGGQARRS